MRLCRNCLDVTIKSCYVCSIGQDIIETSKCSKCKKQATRKKKPVPEYDDYKYVKHQC